MCQLDWWKHKHAQLLLAKRSKMWLFNYCSAITSSIPTGIFRYFIIACQGIKYESGHKRVRAQTYSFLPRHDCDHTIITCVSGHKHVWIQTCIGTIMSGQKCVWHQTCMGTNVSGHKRVWVQKCAGSNVSGHKRVWAQSCVGTNMPGHNRVGSSMYGHKRMVSMLFIPFNRKIFCLIWHSFFIIGFIYSCN